MKEFETLLDHAKQRVQTTETPLSLYARAERKRNIVDALVTALVSSLVILIGLFSQAPSPKLEIQPPAVKEYLRNEIYAMGGSK